MAESAILMPRLGMAFFGGPLLPMPCRPIGIGIPRWMVPNFGRWFLADQVRRRHFSGPRYGSDADGSSAAATADDSTNGRRRPTTMVAPLALRPYHPVVVRLIEA